MPYFETPEEALAHFGVKGMHWGVRKDTSSGVSRSTDREARKDAQEFARAKLFYGEGAGTRRKLIKAKVESRSKKDVAYAKAFQAHLDSQDLEKHASKAQGERRRKDVAAGTAKTARGIKNVLTGNTRYATVTAILIGGGAIYAHKLGIDKMVFNAGKTAYKNMRGDTIKAGMSATDFLRKLG